MVSPSKTTTYSFAFDFPNYYFNAHPSIVDGSEMFTISLVKENSLIPLYKIKAINFMDVDGQDNKKPRYGVMQACLCDDQGIQEANISLFNPLTGFLTAWSKNKGQTLNKEDKWKFQESNKSYVAEYSNAAPSMVMMVNKDTPINSTPLYPTFTFGFDNPLILEPFYNHFDPVKYLNLNYTENPEKAMFDRDPYSGRSKALFSVMFEPLGMTEQWANFFAVLEFTRLSFGLAMAREINQEDTNFYGNQAYMRILSKTTFRSLFQNIIPMVFQQSEYSYRDPYAAETDAVKILNPFKELCRYISLCFTEPFKKRIPFWHLNTTATIAGKQYIAYNSGEGKKVNPNLAQYYRDKASVENILSSMILTNWETQGYPEELQKGIQTIFGATPPQNVTSLVNVMVDNMATFDLMSPVPFSLPTSPMGYNTRYAVAGTPKFMLDVTYIKTLYEKMINLPSGSCVYNSNFMTWCVQQFNMGRQDWAI
jgi:hypothetical protein